MGLCSATLKERCLAMLYDPLPPVLEQWLKQMGVVSTIKTSRPTPEKEMAFKSVTLDKNGEPLF